MATRDPEHSRGTLAARLCELAAAALHWTHDASMSGDTVRAKIEELAADLDLELAEPFEIRLYPGVVVDHDLRCGWFAARIGIDRGPEGNEATVYDVAPDSEDAYRDAYVIAENLVAMADTDDEEATEIRRAES
jgi:hypothetical protein